MMKMQILYNSNVIQYICERCTVIYTSVAKELKVLGAFGNIISKECECGENVFVRTIIGIRVETRAEK